MCLSFLADLKQNRPAATTSFLEADVMLNSCLIAKLMADKEVFERGPFANSMDTRSCITPKDNVDE